MPGAQRHACPLLPQGPSREGMLGGFWKNRVVAWAQPDGPGDAPLVVQVGHRLGCMSEVWGRAGVAVALTLLPPSLTAVRR